MTSWLVLHLMIAGRLHWCEQEGKLPMGDAFSRHSILTRAR